MTLFLIGFMGSGKSTIGRRAARIAGCDFIDMDTAIEQRCGKSIAEIFAAEGESSFRAMESAFLRDLDVSSRNMVVAAGGGAACHGDNMEIMKAKGLTVYLKVSPEKLFQRLETGRDKRPKLAGKSDEELMEFIEVCLAGREKCYEEARMTIECGGMSDERIAERIALLLKED